MIDFIDRVPDTNKANRKKIMREDGTIEYAKIVSADDAVEVGTPLNRANLMALQGFQAKTTTFNGNVINEVDEHGAVKGTTFNADGSITETFIGEKTITKRTIFSGNTIREVLE